MKRKNILFNIALLALSLCVMVYGVYSAKTASLNVSGTIGFQAHDILLTITRARVVSGALTSAGAQYTAEPEISGTTVTFGDLYYDDLNNSTSTADNISPIVITIEMQNTSKFAARVEAVSTAKSAGDGTNTDYTLRAAYSGGSTTNMAANGGTCTVTVTLTYKTDTSNAHGTGFDAATFNISTSVVKA